MKRHLAVLGLAAAVVAACEPNRSITDPDASIQARAERDDDDRDGGPGAVYTITNAAAGNAVVVYARASNGALSSGVTYPTGGTGTGAGLGSQGAVALSEDGLLLFAVNAGSNDVSVFQVSASGLTLATRFPSGGIQPTSLTVRGNLVYVLNAGGNGNITGFRLTDGAGVTPLAGSTQSLSGASTAPAQVSFSPDGRQLIVAERATNLLGVYPVDRNGVAGAGTSFPSAGGTPFGFAFRYDNTLFVSEAAAPGSASSYDLTRSGRLRVVSGAIATHQGAPCWAVVTLDGRFGYTGNGAGSVTGFRIARDGSISLLNADGATAVVNTGVNDIALSNNSRYLYVLGTGAAPELHAYRVQRDGQLQALGAQALPAGARGLVAF
jgi:6-phosphogluconolactonase